VNYEAYPRGRVWLMWIPNNFEVSILSINAQGSPMQGYLSFLFFKKSFHLALIYGSKDSLFGIRLEIWFLT